MHNRIESAAGVALGRILSACLLLAAVGCQASPDPVFTRGTVHIRGVASDNLDSQFYAPTLDTLFFGDSGYASDHWTIDLGMGATFVRIPTEDDEEGTEARRIGRAEFRIANPEIWGAYWSTLENVDALEISGGGRIYLDDYMGPVHPFLSGYTVFTVFDEVSDIGLGTHVGFRGGLGFEVDVTDDVFFDFGWDYQWPIVAAQSDFDPTLGDVVDLELQGWAFRIGLGYFF